MGRAPYAISFSKTCIAIFPEPLITHLEKIHGQIFFKLTKNNNLA
jgi:hypothetical protein